MSKIKQGINVDHDKRLYQKPTYTIPIFCDDHNISKAFLYKLFAEGKGPRVMKIGRRTLISAEAAAEWRAKMEAETEQNGKSFWEIEQGFVSL